MTIRAPSPFLWPAALRLAAGFSLTLFCACSLFVPTEQRQTLNQRQRESAAGKTTADVVNATRTTPPTITVEARDKGGAIMRVETPAAIDAHTTARTTASELSNSAASGAWLDSETVPLFAKIIGAAIGLFLLAAAVFWLLRKIRQGAAGQGATAAYSAADAKLASIINGIQSRAVSEQSTEAALVLSALTAELEKARGQLAAAAPAAVPPKLP